MSPFKFLLMTFLISLMWTKRLVFRLLRDPKRRRSLIITITVYVITFCVVLPFLCHDLPLTKYYTYWNDPKDIIDRAERLNRVNADNAEKRLAVLPKNSTKRMYEETMKPKRPDFVIAVQTIPRSGDPPPRYLTQVMVALHDILEHDGYLRNTAVFMCHTQRSHDDVIKEHHEAVALSEYFPLVVQRPRPASDKDRYEHEKQAYLFCLREAHKLNPYYVIILEDDTLPHTNFLHILKYVLRHKVDIRLLPGELRTDHTDWSWMKLNMPNNLMKYERNYYFALEWTSISLIASGITTVILTSLHRMRLNKQKASVLQLFLVGFVYFMLFTWVLGRSYITLPLHISDTFYNFGPGTSCCTPAVLYPRERLPDIMDYLETITLRHRTPLDFALEDYRTKRNFRQYLINPNLCTHIGVVSSLRGRSNHGVAENYLFAMKNLRNLLPTWFVQ